jgi:branched-chain amino acid transport system ATP-binding protein
VGRTFQHVGLVRSFTVLENVMVAQHRKVGYGLVSGLTGMPWSLEEEKTLRVRAYEVLDYLGLAHLADERLSGCPTACSSRSRSRPCSAPTRTC